MGYPVGQRFGRLIVLHDEGKEAPDRPRKYSCNCDCGNRASVRLHHLTSGAVVSCGCWSRERARLNGDRIRKLMAGLRFGRLVVVEQTAERTNRGHIAWLCRCDCGNSRVISGSTLRQGLTNSCGCISRELIKARNRRSRSSNPWAVEANAFRADARLRQLSFDLTAERFSALVTSPCHYCGVAPDRQPRSSTLREQGVLRHGIDRIDSSLGYADGNCVSCCPVCNVAKFDLSLNDFIESTQRRYEHMLRRGMIA
jgi:hypothetical protein